MHIPAPRLLSLLLLPPLAAGMLAAGALTTRAADQEQERFTISSISLTPAQASSDASPESLPFARPDRMERYQAWAEANPDWTAAQTVLWVNMDRDRPFYTDPDTVEQPDSLTVLVNKYHLLSADYVPELESVGAGYGSGSLRPQAADAFRAMADAARADGISLRSVSAYRSYDRQESIYRRYLSQDSQSSVDTYSARPGSSEHQTGLALDINVASLKAHFEDTPAYAWLVEHCAEFGFVLRYPQGKESITGYQFEPWHYRYVGREIAQVCMDQNLTLEEYFALQPTQSEPDQKTAAPTAEQPAPPKPDPDLPLI